MKKLFQIVSGNTGESEKPVLSFRIGQNHCCFAIVENDSASLKELYYYNAENLNVSQLDEVLAAHPRLQKEFYNVLIGYDYSQNFLSPAAETQGNERGEVPESIISINQPSLKLSETISRWQIQNTYWVPAAIHEWVTSKFKSGKYMHHDSILLEQINDNEENGYMSVDFRNEEFVLMVSKNNRLFLLQAYSYATPDDVLFYLLKACNQFALNQNQVRVQLSGLIDSDSSLYKELCQYFINIGFREASWKIPGNEYPVHFFTSLKDLAKCG